ncbi:Glycerophosphodiester phosphodiesterase domain-containing protein [Xylaria flabelliformis]|nr:Glycerophosphodiester phosphodiesterase domain-containing protein [Xylaria flabelliformis]
MTAADHGAAFVEFDTQVSRDLQTVIYHDFSLSETGTDIPIHELTIDQYKYASSIQTPHGSPLIAPDEQTIVGKSAAVRRTRSFDGQKDIGALLIRDRLKHTVNFKLNAMKPNIRGDVIQDSLVTLPELFQRLPASLGFNIEIKYPRRHEARGIGVAPIALEINLFVDTVLEQIHRYAGQRPIIISSFTPEICILLSIKQKAYPVLFITNADTKGRRFGYTHSG